MSVATTDLVVGEHFDIDPVRPLANTESMSDEQDNVVPPSAMGIPADHPDITRITIELDQVCDVNEMVMTHAGIRADSPGCSWQEDGVRQTRPLR